MPGLNVGIIEVLSSELESSSEDEEPDDDDEEEEFDESLEENLIIFFGFVGDDLGVLSSASVSVVIASESNGGAF